MWIRGGLTQLYDEEPRNFQLTPNITGVISPRTCHTDTDVSFGTQAAPQADKTFSSVVVEQVIRIEPPP